MGFFNVQGWWKAVEENLLGREEQMVRWRALRDACSVLKHHAWWRELKRNG
jgi:hypothetical protein